MFTASIIMGRGLVVLLFLFSGGLCQVSVTSTPPYAQYNHGRRLPVVCYVDKYTHTHPPPYDYHLSDFPTHLCSHLVYAYGDIEQNTWKLKDTLGTLANVTALKQQSPKLKVLLSIGGWSVQSNYIARIASQNKSRETFLNNVLDTLERFGFDGLDIFWQFPGFKEKGGTPEDKENFVHLVKEFKEAAKNRNKEYLLTADVPVTVYILDNGYDLCEMNRYLDWINAIAYELRGKWLSQTDIHSPIVPRSIDPDDFHELNVKYGMRALFDRCAYKRKVMLGMSFYGRAYKLRFPNETGLHAPIDTKLDPRPGPALNTSEIYSYTEICEFLQKKNWTREFDTEGKCPYAYSGDEWVGYEDEESIQYKMDLMRDEGYAGVMVMSADMDDVRGLCGQKDILLQTINDNLPKERPLIYPMGSSQADNSSK